MPPKQERVRIGDLVRRTVARIMMAPPETLAAGIHLLETRGNELAAEWSEKITKQKDPKSLFTAYSVESNMRLQIQRNSRSLVSAYLPVLRSGSIDPLSSTLYLIVSQRVELDFSIEEMLNVFFMFIGLISAAAGGDGAVQDLAVQLTLLTTIIVMEHHRSLTPSVEEEDVLAVTGDSMKLSCDEFHKLVKQYEDLNDTETVKVPATYARAHTRAHSDTHTRTNVHACTRARTHRNTTQKKRSTDRIAAHTRLSDRISPFRRRSSKPSERGISTAPRVQTSSTRGMSSGREL